ncbi:hypothetical protein M8C13_07070 [Crossiella sp. SN42]|uniref:hypothetical protein n=1 Tax=Crossiella sp. SN42 TaxID=2944808 RepID=UPI00207C2C9B|nr:hypothetical protein [Crossiella sp. SN42]MCO1575518.1 hypothetical protein [Crossiella sp. SN42]
MTATDPRHPLDTPTPEEQHRALAVLRRDPETAHRKVLALSTDVCWQEVISYCGPTLPPRRLRALLHDRRTDTLHSATVLLDQEKIDENSRQETTLAAEANFHPHSTLWPAAQGDLWSGEPHTRTEAGACLTIQAFITGFSMAPVVVRAFALERAERKGPITLRDLPAPARAPFQCRLPPETSGPEDVHLHGSVITWDRWCLHVAMHDTGLVVTDISAPGQYGARQFVHAAIVRQGTAKAYPAMLAAGAGLPQNTCGTPPAAVLAAYGTAAQIYGGGRHVPAVEVKLVPARTVRGQSAFAGPWLVVQTAYRLTRVAGRPLEVTMAWKFGADGSVREETALPDTVQDGGKVPFSAPVY